MIPERTSAEKPNLPNSQIRSPEPRRGTQNGEWPELIALFRLLMREPSADHDFRACPICKRYGITNI